MKKILLSLLIVAMLSLAFVSTGYAACVTGPGGTACLEHFSDGGLYWTVTPNTTWYYIFNGYIEYSTGGICPVQGVGKPGSSCNGLAPSEGNYATLNGSATDTSGSTFVVLPGVRCNY